MLRMMIGDKDHEIFIDEELENILALQTGATKKRLDLARADCLEIIASDIQKFNAYSIGQYTEHIDKNALLQVAQSLRKRYATVKGGRLI